jgi:hypothetical protein
MILLRLLAFMFCLQKELVAAADMVIKFYCEDVPQDGDRSPAKMQKLIEKVMEHVRKEHYSTFYKHFPVCDLGLGIKFL